MSFVLRDRIRQIAADVFNEPLERVTVESTPDNLEGWDSLTHLNFLLALEQSFDCEIAPEEGERMATSIGDVVLEMEKKSKG